MRGRTVEPRLVAGVGLMVLATVLGAMTMQHASRRASVWQLAHGLSAGSVITAADVHVAAVAIDQGAGAYVDAGTVVVGKTLTRDLHSMELLPQSALADDVRADDRVTVPVEPLHLPPDLRRGERVDVWITPVATNGEVGETRRVLAAVRVDAVDGADASGHPAVVLAVPRPKVSVLVSALRIGAIDLVGVGGAA